MTTLVPTGPLVGQKLEIDCVTRKGTLLDSVRLGVFTFTGPVVAPTGTVVVISEFETTWNKAAVPLKVTLVVPVRLFPRISTDVPTLPKVGRVSTKNPSPTPTLKIVPSPLVPPLEVVP